MNDLTSLVGIAALVAIALAGLAALAFSKGWIGLSPERIAKIHAKGDAFQDMLDSRLAKKAGAAPAAAVVKRSKMERVAENKALLEAGVIDQLQFDKSVNAILAEP